MKILVFDTETTGLPEYGASIRDLKKWPYIIQISYILYDTSLNTMAVTNEYIKIDSSNVSITPESFSIHKISMDYLQEHGKNIIPVMRDFNRALDYCDIVVGHNIEFDKKLVFVECFRNNVKQSFTKFYGNRKVCKNEYCTMKKTTNFCNLTRIDKKNNTVNKFPKLIELYNKLFPDAIIPDTLHDSLVDILITFRCYIKYTLDYDVAYANNEITNLFNSYNIIR